MFARKKILSGSRRIGRGVRFDWTGNIATIQANLEVWGEAGTEEIAVKIHDSIKAKWNKFFETGVGVVSWVDVLFSGRYSTNNIDRTQIEVITSEYEPSQVKGFGWLRHYGRMLYVINPRWTRGQFDKDLAAVPAHEFGHLLGLDDRYASHG